MFSVKSNKTSECDISLSLFLFKILSLVTVQIPFFKPMLGDMIAELYSDMSRQIPDVAALRAKQSAD